MRNVRLGIIGIGCMGSAHASQIFDGKVTGMSLSAVCDIDDERIEWAKNKFGDKVDYFKDVDAMLNSNKIDAVLIATQHLFHPDFAIKAFKKGLHVLTEKPAGIDTYHVKQMIEESKKHDVIFAIMLNQRMNPLFQELRQIVADGRLGTIKRFIWIINNWYRTQCYYDAGSWRATWSGEGGGVLINQCPHNLDIWQWIIGMPSRIKAICKEGKYHNIQVEDEATIFAEYENGATAVFITSTGEYPGTNRIEISGSKGKAVLENGCITLSLIDYDERDLCFNSKEKMPTPTVHTQIITAQKPDTGHLGILQNFTDAILNGTQLISPGEDGLQELTISNAAYLSSWQDKWIDIPFDDIEYLKALENKRIDAVHNQSKSVEEPEISKEYNDRWKVRW